MNNAAQILNELMEEFEAIFAVKPGLESSVQFSGIEVQIC